MNEAVTEQTVLQIITQNKQELSEQLHISEEIFNKQKYGYPTSRHLLSKIIEKIAEHRNESQYDTWLRFRDGVIKGQMMHLRDVEKIFGDDALKLLSIFGNSVRDIPMPEVNNEITRFFESNDIDEKNSIAEKYLNNELETKA